MFLEVVLPMKRLLVYLAVNLGMPVVDHGWCYFKLQSDGSQCCINKSLVRLQERRGSSKHGRYSMGTSIKVTCFWSLYFCANKWSRFTARGFGRLDMSYVCQFSVKYLLDLMHKFRSGRW
uniref:Uncharacterized protein n=1 Tax=Arundo donax TaxID=35708 RepID=A0A0A9EF97_ARUDO